MTIALDMIRGRSNVVTLTNKSGGALVAGDVCVIDTSNDEAATTTTSAASVLKVYIAAESIANNAAGKFYSAGFCPLVTPSASTTRGRYLFTHTVAKQAAESATYGAGAFGVILKSGTTPSVWLFGSTAQGSGGGIARSGSTTDDHLAVWNGSNVDSLKDGGVAGAGALTLLEQHTGAGVSTPTLDFATAISATYDEYIFEFINVVPATDNVNFWMRVSTDGSTYLTTNVYATAGFRWTYNATGVGGNPPAAPTSQLSLDCGDTLDNSANYGFCGFMRLFNPLSTGVYKLVRGEFTYLSNAPAQVSVAFAGVYVATTAVVKVQFLFSSGDVASGTIRCYGVAK